VGKVRFFFRASVSMGNRWSFLSGCAGVLIDDCWTAFAGAAASTNNMFFISFFLIIAVRVSPYAACFTFGGDIF
jgi:hypothetical protein